ncbi:hypothetical protein DFH09DRAFT_1502736 [Mycena vulgaris]|nr:hypothetical protein DFH09DRAFT_1502736 [Mycena vulgaris]
MAARARRAIPVNDPPHVHLCTRDDTPIVNSNSNSPSRSRLWLASILKPAVDADWTDTHMHPAPAPACVPAGRSLRGTQPLPWIGAAFPPVPHLNSDRVPDGGRTLPADRRFDNVFAYSPHDIAASNALARAGGYSSDATDAQCPREVRTELGEGACYPQILISVATDAYHPRPIASYTNSLEVGCGGSGGAKYPRVLVGEEGSVGDREDEHQYAAAQYAVSMDDGASDDFVIVWDAGDCASINAEADKDGADASDETEMGHEYDYDASASWEDDAEYTDEDAQRFAGMSSVCVCPFEADLAPAFGAESW